MYKIAIIDDEVSFLESFKHYFDNYPQIEVNTFQDSKEVEQHIKEYDVVFIDYELQNMTAFDFFEETKEENYLRILVTKHEHIVYQSFYYEVFDFIRKPYLDEDFNIKLNRIINKLEQKPLTISSHNQILTLPYESIKYIHTQKNYVIIHGKEEYKIRISFKEILNKIQNPYFITIYYGIVVNMQYIKHINLKTKEVILKDDKTLPLSDKYKYYVKEQYQKYKIT